MKAVHVFLSVDMRKGHDGLIEYAKNRKVNLRELPDETAAVFINRQRDKMKTYSYNHVVGYMRSEKHRPFDIAAVDHFAMAFKKDGTMDYSKALKARLEIALGKKGKLKEEHLNGQKTMALVASLKTHRERRSSNTQQVPVQNGS